MVELVLRAPQSMVEPLSDLLVDELEALAVAVEDADAGSDAERALFGEPGLPAPAPGWERSTLRALFETETAAEAAAAALFAAHRVQLRSAAAPGAPGAPGARTHAPQAYVQALQPVPEEDWVRLTQAQFSPVPVTERFWIVPSWHEPPAQAQTVIRLDPGLAFGTGTHATTRMCLRWLAGHAGAQGTQGTPGGPGAAWPRVLDYGCGSGILAIAAAKLGALAVDAVDIDPAAVQATRTNAASNGVAVRAALPDAAHGTYALVLANILATPLKLLAPLLAGHVAAGGWLILAGILARQADELKAAYAPYLALDVLAADEGWVLMGAQRPAAAAPVGAALAGGRGGAP